MPLIAVAVEIGVEIDPSRIVFGVMGVQSEKVAVEALAKPVAYFGLYQPMFPPGVAELPRIVVARYVQRYAGAEPVSALKRMVLKRRGYGSCVQMICQKWMNS